MMKSKKTSPKIRIIDLFAGIGGIRLGVEHAFGASNVDCVFTSEIDVNALRTYNHHFKEDNFPLDITTVAERSVPSHDLLLAGFPCQPFSQAGLKKGFEDCRGSLFFDIARILKEHRPTMFLLENVKQLKGHDKGRTLKTIIAVLEEMDYTVHIDVLRAKDFGVPQNRERVFIVGILGNNSSFQFPRPSHIHTSVSSILEQDVDPKYTISDRLWEGHQRRKKEHLEKGNGFGFSLFSETSTYTNTISARYYKDGSEILIEQAGKNPRKLTPREAARLQGFPDTFEIPVSDTQAYRQFGNSVAVPVIQAIGVELSKVWDTLNTEQKDYCYA
ncbi:MAG: DNA cytosine methyltransferase [Vampirovibrionales bacterium]|jgi:DNA (cytosine-5)-methyltransferase 1|nr:DNA cytosine methyltransferase [Vampirovibrionales bacterium]